MARGVARKTGLVGESHDKGCGLVMAVGEGKLPGERHGKGCGLVRGMTRGVAW